MTNIKNKFINDELITYTELIRRLSIELVPQEFKHTLMQLPKYIKTDYLKIQLQENELVAINSDIPGEDVILQIEFSDSSITDIRIFVLEPADCTDC